MIDDIEQSGQDARTTVGPIEGVVDVSEVRVTQPRIDFDTLQRQFANVGPRQNPLIPAPNEAPEIDQDALNIVNQSRDAMQASLMNATQYSPDEAAEAQRLGAPMKLNYDLVLRNKDQVKHAAMMQDIDRRDLMRNDPILARQLQNLDFAAIAYDDLDNLSQNGSIFKDIASAIGGRPWEMQVIPREIVRGYLRGEAVAERGRVGTQIMLEGETAATAEQVRQLRESMMQLEQFGESGFLSLGAEMVAQNVAGIREVAATTLTGAAIGTGIFPGVGTIGGAYGGFQAGSFLTTARMEAGNAYLDMIEAGVNEDDAKYAAIGTGLVNGLIEVAFQKFAAAPFKGIANKLLRNQINQTLVRPTTRKALADAAKSYVTTVAGEAGEEGLQQLTNIVNRNVARTMSGMDPDVTASEAGAEIVDSFIAGAMGSAIIGGAGPTINVYADIVRANAATRQADFFERLNTNAAAAKVRARNATAYEQFLAAQAQGTNAETIYVDGTVAQGILRQSGITPQQLDAVVPGLYDRVREAAAAGGDVQIPTAQYGARMAGTELGNALTPHLRLAPDAMSAAQAQQFAAEKQNLVDEAKRILEEKKTTETAFVDDALAFEERILAQITEAGKTLETPLTKTQAQAAAKVYQAMYVNLAARAGKTVTQLEQEIGSPLQIRGAQAVAAPLEQPARAQYPALAKAWNRYNTGEEIQTPQDLADSMESLVEDGRAPESIAEAVRQYREAQAFDVETKGRGELDAAGNALEIAVQQAAEQMRPTPSVMEQAARINGNEVQKAIRKYAKAQIDEVELIDSIGAWGLITEAEVNALLERDRDFADAGVSTRGGTTAVPNFGSTPRRRQHPLLKLIREREQSRERKNVGDQASRIDADYMAAVKRGDTEAAQRMVDEAAKASGYTVRAFHGTDAEPFTVFGNYDAYNFGDAAYFSPNEQYARIYAESHRTGRGQPRVLNVALRVENTFSPETNADHLKLYRKWTKEAKRLQRHSVFQVWGPLAEPYGENKVRNLVNWEDQWWLVEKIREAGFDSFTTSESDGETIAYGILNPNQIKLADAITRDEAGNVVPLSQRFDIASPEIYRQAMPARGPARGGIDVTTLLITIGKSADITTLGHEAAHAYFEILGRLAAAPNAPEFFRNDMDILLRFGKIAGDTPEARLATWNATTLDGRRKLHEAFAYNFEIYLFEGKSPSVEMQGLFDRFASWLKRVYKSLRDDLNAIYRREFGEDMPVLTGEVREVMDRMLASDEQIKRQREVQGMKPLLTGRPDGMSDTDWAEYQLLSEQDVNAAIQKLTEASVRNMEWLSNAKSRLIKSLQAKHAKLRKEMRERIATEVAAQPEYRTLKYLRTGMMQAVDGTEVQAEGVTKLNAARVDEIANATTMAQMFDTTTIPNGITVEGGQDPDVVAEMFGFSSGSDMILRISAAKPIKEAIDEQLDAKMEAEYGDMFTPAEVEKQVNKALHNEVRARMVATELKWAAKATQPVRAMLEAARQVARETIGSTLVGELKPAQFIAAEARAAKDALGIFETPMEPEAIARSTYSRVYNRQKAAGATEEAAVASATAEATTAAARAMERVQAFRARYKDGDREQLIVQAKRRQLLQNQLASAAIETQEEIDKAIKGFRKFFKADAKIAESRDLAMVMAARAILASRGIGRSDKAPAAYVEQLQANNPGLYAELAPIIMQAGVGDYRKMTVSEFRVITESVEALWSRARRDRQIQVGEQKVELDLVVSEMIAAMSKIKRPAVQPGVREAVGFKDVAKRQAMEVRAANRRVESWSDALDAADPKRPFTTYLWQPVKDAVVRFRQIRNDKVKKLYELVMQLDIPKNSIDAPELDYTFGRGNAGAGKAELLGAMLHAGNESNYRKLLLGRQWATLDEAGNMDDSRWKRFVDRMIAQGVLTKGDFDFLQAVWDLNEEIKPLLQKAHYDLEGYYFKEVQASPVVTPFGTYRGGYVPAATDRFMVADAVQRAGMQELEQDWRFSLPSTGMGMTKARVESYTKPLALDIRLIVTHVDAALRFAIIQPAIVDALKILKNRSFAAEIDKIDPTAITAMLLPWLNRSAHQTVSQPGRFKSVDAFWRGVRTRTGMSIMFANLRNAFQQITGLFPSAVKVSPVYLKNAVATYLGDPRGTANMIAATDPFMDQRMRDQVYEMQEQMNDLLLNPSKFDKVQAWNKQHAYFIQTAFQNQVDIITWLGAYNQSLAESGVGVSEEKARKQAIRDAGAAVRLTQGSILPEDISAFEAGTPFYRTFTQFAGYFNGIANLNATEMVKTVRTMGFRGGKGKLLYIYLLGFAMPAIVSDAIVRSMGGGWDDDDEDGYLDVFMDWFFGSQIRMGAAFIPFGSTALQAITTPFDNKPYNDRMNNSPSIQALESATIGTGKAIVNVVDEDKELTGKNVRDVLTAVSLATGIPVSVLGRPAGYLVDVYRGEIEPEGPIDFTLGILTGTTAPSTRR